MWGRAWYRLYTGRDSGMVQEHFRAIGSWASKGECSQKKEGNVEESGIIENDGEEIQGGSVQMEERGQVEWELRIVLWTGQLEKELKKTCELLPQLSITVWRKSYSESFSLRPQVLVSISGQMEGNSRRHPGVWACFRLASWSRPGLSSQSCLPRT